MTPVPNFFITIIIFIIIIQGCHKSSSQQTYLLVSIQGLS